MNIAGIDFTEQEIAVLLATRTSENALKIEQIAQSVQSDVIDVQNTLDALVAMDTLEPIESFNGTVYGYTGNPFSQAVYEEVHRLSLPPKSDRSM